jgi:hypothetical protein
MNAATTPTCTRCEKPSLAREKTLCADCLELLGMETEAMAVRARAARYAAEIEAAVTAERERILAVYTLPEATGRWELAGKLALDPSVTADRVLQILAASPLEGTGPAAEFAAHLKRCEAEAAEASAVDERGEEDRFVARVKAIDDAHLAGIQAERARQRGGT